MAKYKDLSTFYDEEKDLPNDPDFAKHTAAVQKVHEVNTRTANPQDPAIVHRRIDTGVMMPIPKAAATAIERPAAMMPIPKKGKPLTPAQQDAAMLTNWDKDTGEWLGQLPPSSLEYRYKRFIDEYLIDYDHIRAAMACGLACEIQTARRDGDYLRTLLAPVIAARTKTLAGRCGLYAEDILKEIKYLATSNMAVYEPFLTGKCRLTDLPYAAQAAIKEITVKAIYAGKGDEKIYIGDEIKIKLYDKLDALKVSGSHLGVLNTKADDIATGQNKQPVIVLYGDNQNVQVLNAAGMGGMAAMPPPGSE